MLSLQVYSLLLSTSVTMCAVTLWLCFEFTLHEEITISYQSISNTCAKFTFHCLCTDRHL